MRVKYDMMSERRPHLQQKTASAFDINSIPAVLVFKDGKVAETLIGVQPKERYEEALRQVAA